jgi:hypothetical protein
VAGEGLAGVFVALLVTTGMAPKSVAPRLGGALGEGAAALALLLVCLFLHRGGRSATTADAPRP